MGRTKLASLIRGELGVTRRIIREAGLAPEHGIQRDPARAGLIGGDVVRVGRRRHLPIGAGGVARFAIRAIPHGVKREGFDRCEADADPARTVQLFAVLGQLRHGEMAEP